jgi:uncharacterized protein
MLAEPKGPAPRDLGPLRSAGRPGQHGMEYLITLAARHRIAQASGPYASESDMPGHPIDHAGLEMLPFEACVRLLGSVPLGRVGFYADGELVILPVNHAMDGQDVVFRTARGSKLTAAEEQGLVAFEADDYDQQNRSGWSVLVTGRAAAVYEEAEIKRLGRLGLQPWATAVEHPFWVRIRPTSVTGRRIPGTKGSAS